jgi:hypothetical protein
MVTDDRAIIASVLLLCLVGAGVIYATLSLGFFNWLDGLAFMNFWRW